MQISAFLELLPVDGLWIDMNEPSNFCNGACVKEDWQRSRLSNRTGWNFPYNLNNQDQHFPLHYKTLDMDAKQYGDHIFFNTHNLYGEQSLLYVCGWHLEQQFLLYVVQKLLTKDFETILTQCTVLQSNFIV